MECDIKNKINCSDGRLIPPRHIIVNMSVALNGAIKQSAQFSGDVS